MLKVWNVLLVILTFCLSIFGTFLTRSGIISSVHAFATSDIGPAFGVFLFARVLRLARAPGLAPGRPALRGPPGVGALARVVLPVQQPDPGGHRGDGAAADDLPDALRGRRPGARSRWGRRSSTWSTSRGRWSCSLLAGDRPADRLAQGQPATNLRRNFVVPGLVGAWVLLAAAGRSTPGLLAALAGALAGAIAQLDVDAAFRPAADVLPRAHLRARRVRPRHRGARVLARDRACAWRNHGESIPLAARRAWSGATSGATAATSSTSASCVVFFGIAASSALPEGGRARAVARANRCSRSTTTCCATTATASRPQDDHIGAVTRSRVFDRPRAPRWARSTAEQRFHPEPGVSRAARGVRARAGARGAGSPQLRRGRGRTLPADPRLERQRRARGQDPLDRGRRSSPRSPRSRRRASARTSTSSRWRSTRRPVAPTSACSSTRWSTSSGSAGSIFVLGAHLAVLPDARGAPAPRRGDGARGASRCRRLAGSAACCSRSA